MLLLRDVIENFSQNKGTFIALVLFILLTIGFKAGVIGQKGEDFFEQVSMLVISSLLLVGVLVAKKFRKESR